MLQVLHNPRYAGAFVYGRVRTRRLPDGKHSTTKVPRSDWQFVIPGIHAGYITWEQFEANQKRLADNALGFGKARKFGPVREGPALLQGRCYAVYAENVWESITALSINKSPQPMSAKNHPSGKARRCASACPALEWIRRLAPFYSNSCSL